MPQSKQKTCQNCKASFVIDAQDFDFYKKIQVPPPTFCPDCRLKRRMTWRNERALYKRKCDLCQKNVIAMYSPDSSLKVYCHECYFSDEWDALSAYGQNYQWNVPFFKQWADLSNRVPKVNLFKIRVNVNCDFTNYVADNKNCYLGYSLLGNDNVMYSYSIDKSKDCLDCLFLKDSELCYENIDCNSNYQSSYLIRSRNCINSDFLFDCHNCQDCFLSSNLRNKQYVFENNQYTKDEYLKKITDIDLGNFSTVTAIKKKFFDLVQGQSLHKFAYFINSLDVTGDNIENSKNIKNSFEVYDAENLKYCIRAGKNPKDIMDVYGVMQNEMVYEAVAPGLDGYRQFFVFLNDASKDLYYTSHCHNCSNLFGCTDLRNKQYCILNKQYTKEEYEELVSKIIEHMNLRPYTDKQGRRYKYGEFFPSELSPFAYNETIAQEYFTLSKAEVELKGFQWREPQEKDYQATIKPEDLPDHIQDVDDSILEEIIGCSHAGKCHEQCTVAFKVTLQELQFYKRRNIPLPRLCPNCRHYQRLKQRNPYKLWHRQCTCAGEKSDPSTSSGQVTYTNTASHFHGKDHCHNEFETSYAPERKEIVYCETCYQSEVV